MKFSRRWMLGSGLALGAALLAYFTTRKLPAWKRERVWPPLTHGGISRAPMDQQVLVEAAAFMGALFGRTLSEADMDELVWRLNYLVSDDDAWRPRLLRLSDYLRSRLEGVGEADFSQADPEVRNRIAKSIWDDRRRPNGKMSQILAVFSAEERNQREFFRYTLAKLVSIYVRSGVPWRARGYGSWPAVPGDPREYTRKGPDRP